MIQYLNSTHTRNGCKVSSLQDLNGKIIGTLHYGGGMYDIVDAIWCMETGRLIISQSIPYRKLTPFTPEHIYDLII